MTTAFGDLLLGNQRYARSAPRPLQGIARAGVTIVTCMDSRLDPLGMVGLRLGDAKVIRTPGGHVTADAVVGCILSTHLLHVHRILVVQHTRCAMASGDDGALRAKVAAATGADLGSLTIGADPDQRARLQADTTMLRDHPLLAEGGGRGRLPVRRRHRPAGAGQLTRQFRLGGGLSPRVPAVRGSALCPPRSR